MKSGVVFDIKDFAVYDGPGMRQTVFLKGCPLRCRWCHNPEGLLSDPQPMLKNGRWDQCGKRMTSEELERAIRKNSGYYAKYGGGVTFSGGEPMMQAEFLIEVLERIPDLHKAVETSGYVKEEVFERVLQHLDFIMMDIKIFDRELHKKYTGRENSLILKNAKRLCRGRQPFIIRIPVIPGINDKEDNFRAIAEWLQGAETLEKVELLPYHKTAGAKYKMLGMEYRPGFNTEKAVWIPEGIFERYGIRSEVL